MVIERGNKEISFDERRKIQLEMLDEIDAFCRSNAIRYSIAFGTLLGAVRHKGFIPWDDDVDIMMPMPDLEKFKALFKSDSIDYIDVDNDNKYEYTFSRLAYKPTYCKRGMILKTYGICIDLYVMIGIPKDYTLFFNRYKSLFNTRIRMIALRNRAVRFLPLKNLPFFSVIQRKCRDYLFSKSLKYDKATTYYVIATHLNKREKTIYNKDLFKKIIDIQFEDRKYMAIADWNYFLQLMYGDYMQLPPLEERVPYHGGKYYWKNN